jgi:hypothetical protein
LPKAQFAAHHHLASQLDPLPDISAEFEADVADLIDIVRRAGRQPRRTVLGSSVIWSRTPSGMCGRFSRRLDGGYSPPPSWTSCTGDRARGYRRDD